MGEVTQGCFLQHRELKDPKILKVMVDPFYALKNSHPSLLLYVKDVVQISTNQQK